jgi:hypothetical protein
MPLNKTAVTNAFSARIGKRIRDEHREQFGDRTVPSGSILLQEFVDPGTGGLHVVHLPVDTFVDLFKNATSMSYAHLIQENNVVRNEAGDVIETRPDAKGWKAILDSLKDEGVIA